MDISQLKDTDKNLDKYYFEYTRIWDSVSGVLRNDRNVIVVEATNGTEALAKALREKGLPITEENADRFKSITKDRFDLILLKHNVSSIKASVAYIKKRNDMNAKVALAACILSVIAFLTSALNVVVSVLRLTA